MYLKVITPRVEFEVAPATSCETGIVITNSEVGCGTLSGAAADLRLVCRNGLIASDHALRKTHVGRSLTTEAGRSMCSGTTPWPRTTGPSS